MGFGDRSVAEAEEDDEDCKCDGVAWEPGRAL